MSSQNSHNFFSIMPMWPKFACFIQKCLVNKCGKFHFNQAFLDQAAMDKLKNLSIKLEISRQNIFWISNKTFSAELILIKISTNKQCSFLSKVGKFHLSDTICGFAETSNPGNTLIICEIIYDKVEIKTFYWTDFVKLWLKFKIFIGSINLQKFNKTATNLAPWRS